MAEDVQELLVRLRPEGAEETQAALEDATGTFEESSDQIEDAAGNMSEFSAKFKGSMQVVVAGLAVASAGLLSQVPVIGEAASGLFAVIDAIAFKMDEVLRPVLSPITEGLFKLADAINRASGPLGDFVGVVATVAATLGLLEGIVIALNAVLGLGLPSVIGTIVGILGGPLTLAILAIVALAGLLLAAWQTNLFGIRDVTNKVIAFLGKMWVKFKELLLETFKIIKERGKKFMENLKNWRANLKVLLDKVTTRFKTLKKDVTELFENLFGDLKAIYTKLEAATNALTAGMAALWSGFEGDLSTTYTNVLTGTDELIGSMEALWSDFKQTVTTVFQALVGLLQTLVRNYVSLWTNLGSFVGGVLGTMLGLAMTFGAAFASFLIGAVNRIVTSYQLALSNLQTEFEKVFGAVIAKAKNFGNRLASIIESAANAAISAIPGFIRDRLGISSISIGRPFGNASAADALRGASRRGSARNRQIRQQSSQREEAANRQLEQLITAMQNTDLSFTLDLDSKTVAEETIPFLDQGAANRGRG